VGMIEVYNIYNFNTIFLKKGVICQDFLQFIQFINSWNPHCAYTVLYLVS